MIGLLTAMWRDEMSNDGISLRGESSFINSGLPEQDRRVSSAVASNMLYKFITSY
jgi:hypothetical protein